MTTGTMYMIKGDNRLTRVLSYIGNRIQRIKIFI